MFLVSRLNEDLYNPGCVNSSSVDPDPMGYFDRIKESENPVVGAVREYWDSALSFAAGYLFSEVSALMLAGGAIVEYIGRKNGESETWLEDYLSENADRFARNTSAFLSGMFLTGPEPKYIGLGLLLGGIAYAFHRIHHSSGRELPDVESIEDNSS